MKAEQILKLFDYHFAMNNKVWDQIITKLSNDQFLKEPENGGRSVRDQLVHMIDVDMGWFEMIQGNRWRGTSDPADFPNWESVLAYRNHTDGLLRQHLSQLEDDTLLEKSKGMRGVFLVWQMFFHVIAHSIDHRSQLMTTLNQMGIETIEQDFALFIFGGEWPGR